MIVRDHIPLEQGLRLCRVMVNAVQKLVRDHIPLEQGLRPHPVRLGLVEATSQRPYSIRTRIKTQQRPRKLPPGEAVRDHIPLEQGLRLRVLP